MILFHDSGYRCLKHFYLEKVCKHLRGLFPKVVSYNRFVELEREVAIPLALFIKKVLQGKCTGISFVDSTPLRVCRNQRIHLHKTFKGIAQRGKCSMGWVDSFQSFTLFLFAKISKLSIPRKHSPDFLLHGAKNSRPTRFYQRCVALVSKVRKIIIIPALISPFLCSKMCF